MINNSQIAQKRLTDDQEQLSHYSRSPKHQIQNVAVKKTKFDNFLQRFKKYENHYQHRREEAQQKSLQRNDSATKNVPTICQKSRTLASEYQTLPIYDRLHESSYRVKNIKQISTSKVGIQSFCEKQSSTKFARSKSCEKLFSTKDKTNQLLQQKFINDYSDAMRSIKGTQKLDDFSIIQLNQNEFQVILMNLGFINYKIQSDEKITITKSDSDLLQQIESVLKIQNDQQTVNSASVLIFLLIIQGLCPQQTFFCENQHLLKAQQTTLQQQFAVLKYSRDNYLMQKRRDNTYQENTSKELFSPFVSVQSTKYAQKRKRSLLDNTTLSQTVDVDQHTIWNIYDIIKTTKIDQMQNEQETHKLKECQFRPILNPITNQINQVQRDQKRIQVSPTQRLYQNHKKQSVDLKENLDYECTFHPKISKTSGMKYDKGYIFDSSLDKLSYDLNRSATIQNAFKTKQFKKSMLERGYPKNIKDWTSHVYHKNKSQSQSYNQSNSFIKQKSQKQETKIPTAPQQEDDYNKPLLFVDVNIGDKKDRLIVYPDQNIDLVVQEFAIKHNLDTQLTKQFRAMLESKIRNILFPIHEVQNSQNYDF